MRAGLENDSGKMSSVANVFESSNHFTLVGPWLIFYSLGIFSISTTAALYLVDSFSCSPRSVDNHALRSICFTTTGISVGNFIVQYLNSLHHEKNSSRATMRYCAIFINLIACFSQVMLVLDFFPVIMSPFKRSLYLPKLLEWFALIPAQLAMVQSLDISEQGDWFVLVATFLSQFVSIILQGLSCLVVNDTHAQLIDKASLIFHAYIYFVLIRSVLKYLRISKQSPQGLLSILEAPMVGFKCSPSTRPTKREEILRQEEMIIKHASYLVKITAVKMTIFSAVLMVIHKWIQILGSLGIIDPATECLLLFVFESVVQILFQRLPTSLMGADLSPECVLAKILSLEEQSNHSIQQFLRFICHEISTHLNAISMCLDGLGDRQDIDEIGSETIGVAREGCDEIKNTTQSVLRMQHWKDASVLLVIVPMDFKACARDTAKKPNKITAAESKLVTVVMALDPRVPNSLQGDKVRIQNAISAIIDCGIHCSSIRSKVTVYVERRDDDGGGVWADSGASAAQVSTVRFGVHVEKSETSAIRLADLLRSGPMSPAAVTSPGTSSGSVMPPSELSVGHSIVSRLLCAKEWVSIHGGDITVTPSSHDGVFIWFQLSMEISVFWDHKTGFMQCEVVNAREDSASQLMKSQQSVGRVAKEMISKSSRVPSRHGNFSAEDLAGFKSLVTVGVQPAASPKQLGSVKDWGGDDESYPEDINLIPSASLIMSNYSSLGKVAAAAKLARGKAREEQEQRRSQEQLPDSAQSPGETVSGTQSLATTTASEISDPERPPINQPPTQTCELQGSSADSSSFAPVVLGDEPVAAKAVGSATAAPSRKKRVQIVVDAVSTALVVDDVSANTKLCSRCLEKIGFSTVLSFDGREALDLLVQRGTVIREFDLIVLDNIMPKMTGAEMISVLRQANYKKLVVGLTGNCLEEDLADFKRSGCDEVLAKPLNLVQLKGILDKYGVKYATS